MQRNVRVQAGNDVAVTLLFMAIVNVIVYQITWVYAGPITALSTIILATMLCRLRGISWTELGLRRPANIWVTLGQAALDCNRRLPPGHYLRCDTFLLSGRFWCVDVIRRSKFHRAL